MADPDETQERCRRARAILASVLELHQDWKSADLATRDRLARSALLQVRLLCTALVDWAVDHIGQAPLPAAKSSASNSKKNGSRDLVRRRHRISNLLWYDPILPLEDWGELVDALRALNLGEVLPLLEPVTTGKHGCPYTLTLHRLEALKHVEFRRGRGMKKNEATKAVAAAFGQSVAALLTWEKRLPRDLGERSVEDALAYASEAGKTFREIKDALYQPRRGRERREQLMCLRDEIERTYGDDALKSAGERYRSVLGFSPRAKS